MNLRIYADTSVIGGCFDEAFAEASLRLFDSFRAADNTIVTSDLTLLEIEDAPNRVRRELTSIPQEAKEYVALDDEAKNLALK